MDLPLTSDTVLVLNSYYSLFIIASFITIAVEETIRLIKRASNA